MKTNIKALFIICLLAIGYACKKPDTTTPISKPQENPVAKSAAKDIISFDFKTVTPKVNSKVDLVNKEVTALLPMDADIKKLIPTITISEKATISPATDQAQDFSNPVTYTVTAEDGSTQAFTVKANTDGYYYKNIRMTVGENNGKISQFDSSLLDYRHGKVYLLKGGGINAENIDLVLDNYCGLTLNPPIVLKNCGVSCGLGGLNTFVNPQNWPIYRIGDIDTIIYPTIKLDAFQYGQIPASDWDKLSFASDIDKSLAIGRKLSQNNSANISGTRVVDTDLSCNLTTTFGNVLYRFISHEGKKGVLRVTSFGKKATGATYITLDIKIQK